MAKIKITPENFTDVFWPQVLRSSLINFDGIYQKLEQYFLDSESLRQQANYNTGTINLDASIILLSLVRYFKCQTIVEVGTFIGNSAYAMACGLSLNGQPSQIFTCDGSNAINLQFQLAHVQVQQYQNTLSSTMFSDLAESSLEIDLLYLDGRLTAQDIPSLQKLLTGNSVIVFDDFEGAEKGVANLMLLRELEKLNRHVAIYPPQSYHFAELPLRQRALPPSKTAVFFPVDLVEFCPQ